MDLGRDDVFVLFECDDFPVPFGCFGFPALFDCDDFLVLFDCGDFRLLLGREEPPLFDLAVFELLFLLLAVDGP